MRRQLSYAHAAELLGGSDSSVVKALDKLAGGLLLVATGGGSELAISLFDAKAEFATMGQGLVGGLKERLSGLNRFERTQRLTAAHSVIVLTAFFETVPKFARAMGEIPEKVKNDHGRAKAKLVKDRKKLGEQVYLATGKRLGSERTVSLAKVLLHSEVPTPEPHRTRQEMLDELCNFYRQLLDKLPEFRHDAQLWEELGPAVQAVLRQHDHRACRDFCTTALASYEAHLHRLAIEFPEVAYWISATDHRAIQHQLHRVEMSLSSLSRTMEELATGRSPDRRRRELAALYQDALSRPIVETGEVETGGLRIPLLAHAYIDPDFRAAEVTSRDRPHLESWWAERPARDNIGDFLTGYLTSNTATTRLLLVLGQPGSGKSVLTKVLAARLPAADFMVVRVVLREIPAEAALLDQIEFAIRDATHAQISWTELAGYTGDALPVVLLDGFDELLQTTGVSQSDYLEKIAEFQSRERIHGRPLAVILTSRTAVADRARIPADGVLAIRLEPFREEHVERWVSVWNDTNSDYLHSLGQHELSVAAVMDHEALATQPLLLLMLALYDADDNGLVRMRGGLRQAQLYESLLSAFAEREVRKARPDADEALLREEVDRELHRLSIVAFAMFNRGRLWTNEDELNSDFAALLGRVERRPATTGSFRAPLTASQIVVGKFFFIHEARAIQEGNKITTCEFLHATFGEFLVARLVYGELHDMATLAEAGASRMRQSMPEDSFLHALLSYAPLSARATTLHFLTALLRDSTPSRISVLRTLLLSLFHAALEARLTVGYVDYRPMALSVPARHAAYSANLLLLYSLVDEWFSGSDLFPRASDIIDAWRRQTLLWRAQLPEDGWSWLAVNLTVRRTWEEGRRNIRIAYKPSETVEYLAGPLWSLNEDPATPAITAWHRSNYGSIEMENTFVCDAHLDFLGHVLEPMARDFHTAFTTFAVLEQGRCVSAASALLRLWVVSSRRNTEELADAYDDCLKIALHAFAPFDVENQARYREALLRQFALDRERLPGTWRDRARLLLEKARVDPKTQEWAERAIVKLGFPLRGI
ncbi:hypothetical protein [Nonomuraea sp. NPDC049141]|uniref:NACHT domain-containing protein n=1 Tax=Nonomuraea sp. NPDC049141 TaxID=3155500 RepID=UPI0033EA0F0A